MLDYLDGSQESVHTLRWTDSYVSSGINSNKSDIILDSSMVLYCVSV